MEKDAKLKMTVKSKSGYSGTVEAKISKDQYRRIMAIIEEQPAKTGDE